MLVAITSPRVGSPKDFWGTLKSISAAEIGRQANRPINLALVGSPELRSLAKIALYATPLPLPEAAAALPGPSSVHEYETTSEEAQFPRNETAFDIVIDVGGGRVNAPDGIRIYAVDELGGWEAALDRILEDRPDLSLALARSFPIFRRRVAQSIIAVTATVNAQFSLITGITAAFPLLGVLLPVNGLSDILMLTKNQVMMTLRLAAAYGLDVEYKSRMKEVAPLLINAFGWRAIARELVGAIPGVGFLARATISYAGTVTVGKTAQFYYETGEHITREQMKRWYLEAYESSREKIRALAAMTKRSKREQRRQLAPLADAVPLAPATNELVEVVSDDENRISLG